jgi:formamidopyrimidine-DNA glycosylase
VYRGLGNIYADESLWRARIHPQRHAAQLSAREQKELYRGIRKILAAAIRLGGSSISDYVNSDGEPGTFQIRHQAYDREGKPCWRCGQKIRRIIVAGRSSYFCPRCQPAPRRRRKAALRGPRKRARRTPRVIDGDGRATPRVRRTAAPQRRAR